MTMSIDLEGAPLKTSLGLCLKQLDLIYDVRDGFLLITSERGLPPLALDHAYLIEGHCLLALIAAGLGGALAPLVSDRQRGATGGKRAHLKRCTARIANLANPTIQPTGRNP